MKIMLKIRIAKIRNRNKFKRQNVNKFDKIGFFFYLSFFISLFPVGYS